MITECSMKFAENDILTKEILQHIYDDSLMLSRTLLSDVKTAVVSGLKIINTDSGDAQITSGVFKIDGKLMVYDGDFIIKANKLINDQHYRVYVQKKKNKYVFCVEEDDDNPQNNIIYRFLYDGSGVVKIPDTISELIRDNIYLEMYDMPWCDISGNYICNPEIAKCLFNELSMKLHKSSQEMFIYYELLNRGNVGIHLVLDYIYGYCESMHSFLLTRDDLKNLSSKLINHEIPVMIKKEVLKEEKTQLNNDNDGGVITKRTRRKS